MAQETPSPNGDEFEAWRVAVEDACRRRGIKTREGIVYDAATGEIGDAMQWEVENET